MKTEAQKGRIFTVGDIHGNPKIISNSNWSEAKDLTEDDIVIFLGDFGMYWNNVPSDEEKYWLDWLAAKPFTVAFIDGNHENFDIIEKLPLEDKWDGIVNVDNRKQGNIYRLRRGEIYNIHGKSILTIGGALSIDKHYRTEGISWWAGEQLTKADEENTLNNLDTIKWKVDYVLTHTCPSSIIHEFLDGPNSPKFNDPASTFLEFIDERLEYNKWLFGHFHTDRLYEWEGDVYQCLYNTITEIK